MYAQTNIQLYKQLQNDGYSGRELNCVRNVYELAMQLSSGLYRPSGKTNIDHFVGTASILSALRVPVEVVAAGLLHSVYIHGDFGGFKKGISGAKRKLVRLRAGQKVEEYVARYAALEWNPRAIPVMCDSLPTLDSIDRAMVLIRLADRLEDCLDQGYLYCPNAEGRQRDFEHHGHIMIEMAEELGFPKLASEFKKAFRQTTFVKFPLELRNPSSRNRVFLVAPKSYTRLLPIATYQAISSWLHYLRQQLAPRLRRWRRRLTHQLPYLRPAEK